MDRLEERKSKAALYLALMTCRGAISDLLEDCDYRVAYKALESTTPERIAKILGLGIDDLFQDWDDCLAPELIRQIKGVDLTEDEWDRVNKFTRKRSEQADAFNA